MPLDSATGTASAPADNAASAPVVGGGNPDHISIPRSQYDTLVREHGSLKAAEPFRSWGQKLGINDPNKFKDWEPIHQVITDRRMTHAEAAALLRGQPAAQPAAGEGGDKPLTRGELDQAIAKLQKDHDGQFSKVSAMGDHKLSAKQQDALRTKILTEVLGEKPNDAEKAMFDLATDGWFEKNRRLYPDGHPLAGEEYMPHDEQSLAPLGAMLKGYRARAEAESAVSTADSVLAGRGKTQSAAGATAATSTSPTSGTKAGRPGAFDREAAQADSDKKSAARYRSPI